MDSDISAIPEHTFLEISLGDEQYAFDVTYVEEIVELQELTRVPNTPECVRGLIDLRGHVTTVLDPGVVLDSGDRSTDDQLIVVFDSEVLDNQGTVGWLVDDVQRVSDITAEEITDPPEQHDWMEGVIPASENEYIVWISPDLVFSEVEDLIAAGRSQSTTASM